MRSFLPSLFLLLSVASVQGGEIGFVEDFALTADRPAALQQLIPGTEDYYYWHCLQLLNTQQFAQVENYLRPWVQRHGETPRVWEIRTRRAILSYEQNPGPSLDYLRNRFGIHYPHRKEELHAEPNFPTALDPALITRQQFLQRALAHHGHSLHGIEDRALDWLIGTDLNPDQRRMLLARLARPDHAQLVKLVADDLNHKDSGGFGSHPIHQQLLRSQLEELLTLKPDLLNQQQFVRAYLTKLQPGPDVDWQQDPAVLEAYLDRLQAFAARLAPVHNSLKAHVLYHRLHLDRSRGEFDKNRLLAYLRLPRPTGYISRAMRESDDLHRFACDLGSNYDGATLLPPIGDDEPLVRSCLAHFLLEAADAREFEPYVNDIYLRHLLAETKIVHGRGTPEQWASLLPPEQFRQLKERVDLDFDFTNQTRYQAGEPVRLGLHVKNVSTLIVKVFQINTLNFYRQNGREIDTDINLDGLVANVEQTHTYQDPPLRRVQRTFDFPTIRQSGVYVVDFIGSGQSSRALIRIGQLKHLVRTTPAGHRFTVLDEENRPVQDAALWLAGHEYRAAKDGAIHVPFTTRPGRQAIVLTAPVAEKDRAAGGKRPDTYSSLGHFNHEAESYQLVAGFYVDREALLKRQTATLLVRPGLLVNGTRVSLKLLEQARLTITSTDLDGISSTSEVNDFPLFVDRESTHEFQVPPRLAEIRFRLSAKVQLVTTGGPLELAAEDRFGLNEIDRTEKIEDLHLLQAEGKYFLELRGRTGEPRASRPVSFQFKHRDFRDTVGTVLKTDPQGRIALGPLDGIATLSASGPEGTSHAWTLVGDRHTYPASLHARAGDPVAVPYLGTAAEATRSEISLLELSGGTFAVDRFENVKVQDGLVLIQGLPAGDYSLLLKATNTQVLLRVAPGEVLGRYIAGPVRQLETPPLAPLQVSAISVGAEQLTIKLTNVSPLARVHVFAARYLPAYDAFRTLSTVHGEEPYVFRSTRAPSVYLTGRNIGDEYRYIIDRRYARKYPGNMLERPSLLLNPWAVRETETGQQLAGQGGAFGGVGREGLSEAERGADTSPTGEAQASDFAHLDWLATAAPVAVNLVPDEQGIVQLPVARLGDRPQVYVLALDPLHTTCRSITRAEPPTKFLDLRLAEGLDPQGHFTQQKQISIVPQGQAFNLQDISTARFESYDSLARVYGLYATLNADPKLAEFAFLLNWPQLKPEEKRTQYSKYASHELSFFLSRKDPEFFRTVIQPYLAHKRHKTFLDHYLLGSDLRGYLEPWNYGQLNVVERILLGRRMEGEHPRTARHVGDLYALLPPDVDGFIRRFDTAVQRSALETDDKLGLQQAFDQIDELRRHSYAGKPEPDYSADTTTDAPAPPAAPMPSRPAEAPDDTRSELEAKKLAEVVAESKARDGTAYRRNKEEAGELDQNGRLAKDAGGDLFGDNELAAREVLRQLYRKPDKTWEWAENDYHHLEISQQDANLITVNAFWRDYAAHDPGAPFLSQNFAEATRNFPEMLLALAVLDLPFTAAEHKSEFDGARMTLTPGGPLVVFHEEIQPAAAPDGAAKVLVSQNFFKHGDRTRTENGEQVDKFVTGEFLTHNVYGCQVVITNPTSTRQKLAVLVQIPRGALPVLQSHATRTLHLNLEPYHTQTVEYHFYFPAPGKYPQFPVHVAKNEKLIAAVEPVTLNVVDRPTVIDTESWDYVSQHGSLDDVLRFLDSHNIHELNLDRVAWRLHDKAAFAAILDRLTARHVYQHTLWSYALLHNVLSPARQYLQHAEAIVQECGGRLASSLLTIDPVLRRTYAHLEYKPLVNARAHALGPRRQIVNDRFHEQYHKFLRELAYTPTLDDNDLLAVTYYLLLQDRVAEALETFARVKRAKVATPMQYDYCAAYLMFFSDQPEAARAIAAQYANHPVDRWRNTFAVIAAQLDEVAGREVGVIDPESRDQQQAALAASEPGFDFTVEGQKLRLNYQNLAAARINFYEMDVELLFSRNPFVREFGSDFSWIQPNQSLEVELPKDQVSRELELPEPLRKSNVLVEIVAGGQTKTQPYFANSLVVQTIENYGQVQVTHRTTRQPVSKVYVKIYAETAAGEVKFYKDGYTDLRGRFDYASLNTNELDAAQKFAILVLSDDHGAVVREALPPKQ